MTFSHLSLQGGSDDNSTDFCSSHGDCSTSTRSSYSSPPVYYVTLRAINAAGLVSLSSSNGVRVDTSPPVIERKPVHFDVELASTESVSYQGNNHTIMASWKFVDRESDILEYQWAIGTSAGASDLQGFQSVGLATVGQNARLQGKLFENHAYYVTVMAVNGAGLQSVSSSSGVILITATVNATQASSAVTSLFTSLVNTSRNASAIRQTADVERAGIKWHGLDADLACRCNFM